MARWNNQDSGSNGMFVLGALAGALVGAGVALLMAPKTGAETRQDLSDGYSSVRDAASRRYRDLADKANAKIDQATARFEQASAKFEKKADRFNGGVSDAVDSVASATGYQALEPTTMLTTILVLLVVLWLLGMVSSYTLGGFIHLLLVLAIAVVLIRVIQGRNPI